MQEEGLVYTNENCIGCNKCVGVCSAMGACIAHVEGGKAQIAVDSLRCTACGACFGVCAHDARSYHDDTKRFFRDLGRGEPISLLISPALSAEYPELYGRILGTLRHLGAQRMLPVAFGADIYTWATLRYLDAHDRAGFISSRCPVIVSYIEHFHPELLSQMLPIQNPAMCMAIYARKRLRLKEKFAYIGPCIASSFDVQHKGADAYVSYNLTFQSLLKYLRAHGISEESCDEEIGYGLGLSYPAANGLASNLHWFLGDDIFVRVVSGKRKAYRWLDHNADAILGGRLLFSIIDIVNCSDGCLEGTAKESGQNEHDEAFSRLMQCIHAREQLDEEGPWSKRILPKERLALLNARQDTEASEQTQKPTKPKMKPDDEAFMQRAMKFIEDHISDLDMNIGDMAEATATSRSGLNRKMKSLLGVTPLDFIREARIRKACAMLSQGAMVKDVAYACGFSDVIYFRKCFKAEIGKTPSEYRDENYGK